MKGSKKPRKDTKAETKPRYGEPPFLGVLGETSQLRVLSELLASPDYAYTKLQLATDAGVARTTLDRVLATLLARGMVVEARRIGHIRLYRLNAESPLVKALDRFSDALAESTSAAVRDAEAPRPPRGRS